MLQDCSRHFGEERGKGGGAELGGLGEGRGRCLLSFQGECTAVIQRCRTLFLYKSRYNTGLRINFTKLFRGRFFRPRRQVFFTCRAKGNFICSLFSSCSGFWRSPHPLREVTTFRYALVRIFILYQ